MKTYTLQEAMDSLPALAREAYDTEPVVLVDGSRLLILQPYNPPPPWEMPREESRWENSLALDSSQDLDWPVAEPKP
jgi:hypothetical protein